MGLDMYLTAERYLSRFNNEDKALSEAISGLLGNIKQRVKTVQLEAAYWRKANQIHQWFVTNVQNGEDECRPHYVSREQLVELRDLCTRVLVERGQAATLLPCQQGFFFGRTDYDEWYFKDLEDTITQINAALELPDTWSFEYCSSW